MSNAKHPIDYTLRQQHSAESVELEFTGTLHGQPVLWQAEFCTLRHYCLRSLASATMHNSMTVQAQAFIDIQIQNQAHRLLVAVNLPVIDEPAILRTIIMIRQYKRLTTGRHHYGDTATFCFDIN